jgi:hypothetical protein
MRAAVQRLRDVELLRAGICHRYEPASLPAENLSFEPDERRSTACHLEALYAKREAQLAAREVAAPATAHKLFSPDCSHGFGRLGRSSGP